MRVGVLVIRVLVFTVFCIVCTVFCIVSFMNIYFYLFCLYSCKDYCHLVTTQLQLVVIIKIIKTTTTDQSSRQRKPSRITWKSETHTTFTVIMLLKRYQHMHRSMIHPFRLSKIHRDWHVMSLSCSVSKEIFVIETHKRFWIHYHLFLGRELSRAAVFYRGY